MDEKLIQRLESAVARLEALSTGFRPGGAPESGEDVVTDPSILAFDDLMGQYFARVLSAAEKIGGQVLEATKILKEAFSVQRELLVKVKQTQVGEKFLFFSSSNVKLQHSLFKGQFNFLLKLLPNYCFVHVRLAVGCVLIIGGLVLSI